MGQNNQGDAANVASANLNTANYTNYNAPGTTAQVTRTIADEVYRYWLTECLHLAERDRATLKRVFGLSDSDIDAFYWCTIPGRISLICLEWELYQRFGEGLRFVPGWYQDSQRNWRVNLRPDGGLLYAQRDDRSGLITRLCILPHPKHNGYYLASPDTGARLQRASEVLSND